MTKDDKESSIEAMLSKIPVTETRGSLLSAISNLLRVIDISESSIMIPTLLKDKCEFDAYEMLTLAKILKASILGHEDLVKFYMYEQSNLQFDLLLAQQHQHQQLLLQSTTPSLKSSSESTSSSSNNQLQLSPTSSSSLTTTTTTTTSTPPTTRITPQLPDRNRDKAEALINPNSNGSNHTNTTATTNIINNDHLQFNERAPSATISLLMQVEQLKKFIPQVTGLFESIIELYRTSVECTPMQPLAPPPHSRNSSSKSI